MSYQNVAMPAKQGGARTALIEYRVFQAGPGAEWEIRLLARPGAALSLVEKYLDDICEPDRKKCIQALVGLAARGPSKNPTKNGKLGDGLFEVKEGKHRIAYFYDSCRSIVVTHGFYRRQNETPTVEKDRAKQSWGEYLESR